MCGEAGRPSFFGKKSFCLSLKKPQRISDPVVSKALSLFLREVWFDLVTQSCRPGRRAGGELPHPLPIAGGWTVSQGRRELRRKLALPAAANNNI